MSYCTGPKRDHDNEGVIFFSHWIITIAIAFVLILYFVSYRSNDNPLQTNGMDLAIGTYVKHSQTQQGLKKPHICTFSEKTDKATIRGTVYSTGYGAEEETIVETIIGLGKEQSTTYLHVKPE